VPVTLHLMVGLPCSGKTTLARRLEAEHQALRLTPDEWQIALYGQDAKDLDHDRRHGIIEGLMWDLAERVLQLGTSVILDFGFWTREERDDFRVRAARLGVNFAIHYAACAPEDLLRRLAGRNAAQPAGAFVIGEGALRQWMRQFEAPDADELSR
jgi:predicted kinase